MKNQPNEMVTLEWLLPLLNEQLSQLSDGWQKDADPIAIEAMVSQYQQLSSTFMMIKLPLLADLAIKLSVLATIDHRQLLNVGLHQKGRFAHQLLQYELTQYVQTGSCRFTLLGRAINSLSQSIAQHSVLEPVSHSEEFQVHDMNLRQSVSDDNTAFHHDVIVSVPTVISAINLQPSQYHQLLTVWRQQIQLLLADNNNQPHVLKILRKVAHYLWQSTDNHQQQLWYVAELWMNNLAQNSLPLPLEYVALLAKLEQVIDAQHSQAEYLSAERQKSQTEDGADLHELSVLSHQALDSHFIDNLIADIYIELSGLSYINTHTKTVLSHLPQNGDTTLQFLPRILCDIETAIFGLDQPRALIKSLQQIKRQLSMRGWTLYESQINQVISDVMDSAESETVFAQMQWQIERQLQELYSAIYDTELSIRNKIGEASSFTSDHTVPAEQDIQQDGQPVIITTDDGVLRQLRIAVEDIKHSFNDYVQRKKTAFLPSAAAFADISSAFEEIGLPEVCHTIDQLGVLLTQLADHDIDVLSWDLTQALADGLSTIELLLDYLAQQVFDQKLLLQASTYIDHAEQLLAAFILNPSVAVHQSSTNESSLAQYWHVTRYDDSGEIAPQVTVNSTDISSLTMAKKESIEQDDKEHVSDSTDLDSQYDVQDSENLESAALQAARSQIQSDTFDIDDTAREHFIQMSHSAIGDVDDFSSIWAQDSQDLTPLMEVCRGFHTLKGLGEGAGAFSISGVSWAIENLLNHILDNQLSVTDQVVDLVLQTTQHLPLLVADFNAKRLPTIDPAITVLQINNLLTNQPLDYGMAIPTLASEAQESINVSDNIITDIGLDTVVADSDVIIDITDNTLNENNNYQKVGDKESEDPSSSSSSKDGQHSTVAIPVILQSFIEAAEQLPADAQDADPDIKEIFIEEAEEVLEEITPLYLIWKQSPETLKVLLDIRRGFHTLKGSGRMVGANYTGELAWSIEDMLNRILDHTIEPTSDIVQLIGDVLAAYPGLINTFAHDSASTDGISYPTVVSLWVACAQAYSKQLGEEFNYPSLRSQWLEQVSDESSVVQSISDVITEKSDHANDTKDNVLETFQSVNELMAETPTVTSDQSKEEREFCRIFIDEAQTLLHDINHFVSVHEGQTQVEVSDNIVRAFHTLRAASGSSALVAISNISAVIEQSLAELQQQDIMMNAQHLQALTQSTALIESYLDAYEQSVQQHILSIDNDVTEDEEKSQQALSSLQMMLSNLESMPTGINSKLTVAQLLESDVDGLLDADYQLRPALNNPDAEQVLTYIQQQRTQIARLASQTIKSPKFTLILKALDNAYDHISEYPESIHSESMQTLLLEGHAQLVSLFDSIAGSMSLKIDAQVIVDLQELVTSHAKSNNDDKVSMETDHLLAAESEDSDLNKTSEPVDEAIETTASVSSTDSDEPIPTDIVKSIQADELQLEIIETDIELLEIFLEEAQELDSDIAQIFSQWHSDIDNITTFKALQRHLHTIKGGARMAGIHSIGNLTHEAENVYEAFVEGRLQPTTQWLKIMQLVQDTLSLQIDYVIRYQECFFAQELIVQLQQFQQTDELPSTVLLTLPALQNHINASNESEIKGTSDNDTDAEVVSLDNLITESWAGGLPDPDILDIFLEEADELIASSNKYLQLFLSNISDIVALQALQRDLHTIKGGARMVAANGIADLAHEMETVYEDLAIRRRPATKMISQLLVNCHDWLADAVFILKSNLNPPVPHTLVKALQQFNKNPDSLKSLPIESLQTQLSAIFAAKTKRDALRGVDNIAVMPPMTGSFAEQEQSSGSNEMMRISGSLIERMINLSGESAINRARIDMGMSSLTINIEEMGTTVQRLADQLRRMENELEQQILSQIDDEELIANEGFDPLEMDQYSSLNQLSKSLTESASDLIDINNTLLEKTRDSENLLLQLSRTQTELQDGLMNSRMVPFARLTPRLERIVRQTANELNKSVELSIINADDEMDRTILERITSPLEHMLRNAVDHGIESPQVRMNAGKGRSGQITLEVLREGSEVVIHLSDDGRGINVDAVRRKAISQGLIDVNDTSLSEIDVMQYIFNAGLTTTKQVTQISGRGVGMDVVISEVRQLGGVVSVTSEAGQGSRFTIRVPLTVAISDALIVRAADRYYAIPLVQIERVVRINPEKLYDYYQSDEPTMRIEDADYRVRYLNDILTGNTLSELIVSTNSSLPVIIVKNRAGQNLALQVDQVAGSRIEVVVKPLGKQLSHLAGISAATIMGDGSVMLILDLIALLRSTPVLKGINQSEASKTRGDSRQVGQQSTILVVDDSVTVRKVTSRFLERQGVKVVVAKDGVDAIEILQELTPDLILLDIEMPRMDGFEVATQVRFNKRLRHIPIIMITSRTGEKHRERAFEIGVNDYMGKPFQEKELLRNIQNLLGSKISLTYEG